MNGPAPVRVGIVDYLNAWPLAWSFLTGEHDPRFRSIYLPPAGVARELEEGSLDVGLIPVIEVQRIAGLAVVPGLCVAATHEVRSVVLVSRRPLAEVRSVALDRNSRTSAALVQILLHDSYGLSVTLEASEPEPEAMLERADAALIIGDPALALDRSRYRVWDLAAEWRELTGLPFVFAVWAVRLDRFPDADGTATVVGQLQRSLDHGSREIDRVIARAVRELGLAPAEVKDYLTSNLNYRLDRDAMDGVEEFYRRAASLDLIPEAAPLTMIPARD